MIETKDVHKSFGTLEVLKGIDLRIDKGEVVSIVGPSGAGKTTLLQILGTLSRPTSGEVMIDGTPVQMLSDKQISKFRNTKIGFVFQFHHLLPEFTAFENVCIPGLIGRRPRAEVERRAVRQAAAKAGARQVTVIEEPMAAAIGSGLPTTDAVGSMIVDIGGGTAEVAVISLSGIVSSRSVRCAGDTLDQSIIAFIKRKYNLLVGERTAELMKMEIGCVFPKEQETSIEIKGRCLMTGLPKVITVTSTEMLEAFEEPVERILEAVHGVLERTPPELVADISNNGIVMTGGGSLVDGFDRLIEARTGIHTVVAEDAISCVVEGTGKSLDSLNSMTDGTVNLSRRRQMN